MVISVEEFAFGLPACLVFRAYVRGVQNINIFQKDVDLTYCIVGVYPRTCGMIRCGCNLVILYKLAVVTINLWQYGLIAGSKKAATPVSIHDRYTRIARIQEA